MKCALLQLLKVKSIVTLLFVITLVVVILAGIKIEEKLFLLFSNLMTAVVTYYFNRKDTPDTTETTNK